MNDNENIIIGRAAIAFELHVSERHVPRLVSAGILRVLKGPGRTSMLRATVDEIERARRVLRGEVA